MGVSCMKKRWFCFAAAFCMLLLPAGCGGNHTSTSAATNNSNSGGTYESAYNQAETERPAEASEVSADGTADFTASSVSAAVRGNAKLILSAEVTLETQTFEQSCADLENIATAAGGYIASSELYGDPGGRRASYGFRVPRAQFDTVFQQLGTVCHMVSSNRYREDITEQYTDTETRLATQKAKHARLLTLLERATGLEDIVLLENALADCEYEIDSLTGELRQYDSLADFARISVWLNETQVLIAVPAGTGFAARLSQAAQDGWKHLIGFLQGTVLFLAVCWPLLLAAGGAGGILLAVRRRKKSAQAKQDETGQKSE